MVTFCHLGIQIILDCLLLSVSLSVFLVLFNDIFRIQVNEPYFWKKYPDNQLNCCHQKSSLWKKTKSSQFYAYYYFKIHFQFLGNRNGTGCESDIDDADIADKEELKLSYVGSDEEDEDYGSSARSPFVKIWCLVTIPQLKP